MDENMRVVLERLCYATSADARAGRHESDLLRAKRPTAADVEQRRADEQHSLAARPSYR